MILVICVKCQAVTVRVRRPRALRSPEQLVTACRARRGKCRSRVLVRAGPREHLATLALEMGHQELANDGPRQERLLQRLQRAIDQLDKWTILREHVAERYPDAPWYIRRNEMRRLIEEDAKAEARRRREAHELEVATARARHDVERARDRLNRAPYTTGIRRPAHWAPDAFFANRRDRGIMPRDVAPDSAPAVRHVRRRLKARSRLERRDPTCGGFFRPPEAQPHVPAHARRAQHRIDVDRDFLVEIQKVCRASVRRRPRGEAV